MPADASGNGRGTLEEVKTTLGVQDVQELTDQIWLQQERIAELEFGREDAAWEALTGSTSSVELSRDALRRIIRDSQASYLKNPLIDHGCTVVATYVFGQGVKVAGSATTNDRTQAFVTDRGNRRTIFGEKARLKADTQLSYEGNVFLALFSAPKKVTQVRIIPTLQIVDGDIVTNPEDDSEPWLYKRHWSRRELDRRSGRVTSKPRVDYYPAVGYRPKSRPATIGEGQDKGKVHWDTPVLHVSDGGLNGGRFGVPTTFSSLAWAKAVVRDLEDYATVRHSLARFAWQVMAKSRNAANTAKSRLSTTITQDQPQEKNPPPVTGATWIGTEGNRLDPIRTAGAQPSPEEGRRVGLMVTAGMGIPETILFGNADVGNLATAKSLDRPTELMMAARQGVWREAYVELVAFDMSRALKDNLVAKRELDPAGDGRAKRATVLTPTVDFPAILERSVTERVSAIVEAATLGTGGMAGTMPDDLLVRLLLVELGVEDIDEVIEELFPPGTEGEPDDRDPDAVPTATEATFADALDVFRRELVREQRPAGRRRRSVPAAAASTSKG